MYHFDKHFEYEMPCYVLISVLNDYEKLEGVFLTKKNAEQAKDIIEQDWGYSMKDYYILEKNMYGCFRGDD